MKEWHMSWRQHKFHFYGYINDLGISDERLASVLESINSEFFELVENGNKSPCDAYKIMVEKNSYRIFSDATCEWNEPSMSADVSIELNHNIYYMKLNHTIFF